MALRVGGGEEGGMMGKKARSFATHHAVCLEALVPVEHFYRHLERALDVGFVRDLVRDCYQTGGRPSIDPVVFFKLQLILFFEGLRSERQLMRVVADRLSLRWYLGYDLGEALPDHSSLTKIRERYGLEAFRRFFDAVVARCQAAGLVWGEELYLDATQVDADAALGSVAPRFAVEAHLCRLFGAEAPGDEAAAAPLADAPPPAEAPVRLPVALAPEDEAALAAANAGRHDWLAEAGRQQRDVTHGDYRRRADYQVSTTDADATVMRRKGGGSHLGYHTHYIVDGGKARVILRVLTTPAEVMENQPALDLVWQSCFRWHLRPRQVTGDTTYGTLDNIVALEDAGVRAYVPLADPGKKTPLFGKQRFLYDPARDVYTCPGGQELYRAGADAGQRRTRYQALAVACAPCPLRARCTTSPDGRSVVRSFDEAYAERVRAYAATPAYQKARRKRQVWVEPLFAEAKEWHGLGRCRLRGLERVNGAALLIAGGQNLKRLLAAHGWGRRPFPAGPAVAAAVGQVASLRS
jgi:transposase